MMNFAVRQILELFDNNNNIPWNQPTVFHLDQIAETSRLSLLLPCILAALQCHLFQIRWNVEVQ